MAGQKKLSRFIAWLLILFQAISLTLVLAILYGILSRSVTHEFYHELARKRSAIEYALKERMCGLERRLSEISRNNTVRVSMMLGVESQLEGLLERQYPYSDGVFSCVQPAGNSTFIPPLPDSLKPLRHRLQSLSETKKTSIVQLQNTASNRYLTLFAKPVWRKNDRLGTAYVIYNLAGDRPIWVRFLASHQGRLLMRKNGHIVDLESGDSVPFKSTSVDLTFARMQILESDRFPREMLVPLQGFPEFMFWVWLCCVYLIPSV